MICRHVHCGWVVGAWLAATMLESLAIEDPPAPELPAYSLTRFTTEQGLPHNSVRALLQSRDGYLWVGTLAGLARFDGVRFTVFDMNNTPQMGHDAINALAEDQQDGSLWVNTGECLLRYRRHQFERLDAKHGVPHPFGRLWPARQGGLWYSPHAGQLVRLADQAVQSWQLRHRFDLTGSEEVLGHRIVHVDEEPDGSLLVLMYVGLLRFDPTTGTVTPLGPPVQSDTSCRHFLKQPDGTLLVAAREGLWRRTDTGWDLVESALAAERQCPARILHSRQDGYWMPWGGDVPWDDQSPPRLSHLRAGRSELVAVPGVPDYPMQDFIEDTEGHLWLGTESGLCRLRPKAVRVYAREQGLRNDVVRTVTAGPDGTIWLGTAAGLTGVKPEGVTNLPPIEPPSHWGYPQGLLADRRGRVWYGAHLNSVMAFEHGNWISPAPLSLGESWVRMLYEDRQGRIWAGFDQGVLVVDESGAVQPFPHTLSHPDVRAIHQDRRGDLWFGTYGGGLNRLRDGQTAVYTTSLDEPNNRVWWIHEDTDGVFWLATRSGLNRFVPPGVDAPRPQPSRGRAAPASPGSGSDALAGSHGQGTADAGRFFTFTTRHGLFENVVNNIQEDDSGFLWLSGLQGIYCVARHELNAVAAGDQSKALVIAFGEADGMLNSQCLGGTSQPSGCKDQAGRIWFPTARGVAMVDPKTIRRNQVPPPVVIEQVVADQEVIFGDASASLPLPSTLMTNASSRLAPLECRLEPGRARVLEIRYTANSFAAPHRMRFKYWLEGYDRDWRHDDSARVAFYTNLRPGRYAFHVTACNNHGVWSESPAVFAFSLAPHFWQTPLFAVLAAAAAIGLAAAVQTYRLRWQHRLLRLEHESALADERTRIARDLHDDLGTALTGLALQIDVLRREAHDGPTPPPRLADSAARLRALAERMRQVVWAVNPRCDTVSSLASFLEQQADQFLQTGARRCRIEFPEDIPALPLDGKIRYQLALAVREALSNAARHANAQEITLGLSVAPSQLIVRVADDGCGFRPESSRPSGNGLANMQARIEQIGGRFSCRSAPGQGTTLEFHVPLQHEARHSKSIP